jgi:nucleoside-diphosphate-sugar epimerase
MNIWVTGSSGFLGSRLASELTKAGHVVVGLSRRAGIDLASDASRKQLQEMNIPDVVVHAACQKPGPAGLHDYVKSNVMTTVNLFESLDPLPKLIIYPSTLSVYGRCDRQPIRESETPKADFPYALTKRWAEEAVATLAPRTKVVVLRLPALYGAGQEDSFVDGLAQLALTNKPLELFAYGKTVRDAMHVSDAVRAIQQCIDTPPQDAYTCLNLGCGQRLTTEDYARALVTALRSDSPIVPVDRPSTQLFDMYADISEARRILGFRPTELHASMERYARELRA